MDIALRSTETSTLRVTHLVEYGGVSWDFLHCCTDLIKVLCCCQLMVPMRVKQAKIGVELLAVLTSQLSPNRVQRDVQRSAVGLWRTDGGDGPQAEERPINGQISQGNRLPSSNEDR